jgi:hypothetical protein
MTAVEAGLSTLREPSRPSTVTPDQMAALGLVVGEYEQRLAALTAEGETKLSRLVPGIGTACMSEPWASTQALRGPAGFGVQPFAFASSLDSARHEIEVLLEVFALEARRVAPVVVRREVLELLELAGQEAAPERAVGDEADAELPAHRGRISSSGSRLQSEYSVCSAAIGWTRRPADRVRGRPPTSRGSAPCRPSRARPWRRPSPRSAPSGRRGAGSRDR